MHKKALTVAVAAALAAPMAAQAVDVTVSGHVARALVITDMSGDAGSESRFKDWGSSPSRFRMEGSGEIMDGGTTAGFKLELGEKGNMRESHVFFSGGFGKIALGDASEAADSRAYSDKSGVFVAHGQESGDARGVTAIPAVPAVPATSYFPEAIPPVPATPAIPAIPRRGAYFGALSGGSNEGIHYTSPSIGMGSLEASIGNDDRWSVSLVLDTDAGGAAIRGEAGILDEGSGKSSVGASLGTKLAGGLTWSAAWAKETNKGSASDPGYIQTTVGYIMGDTSVGVGWYRSSNFENKGSKGTILGLGVNHNLPKVNAHVFASVQQYKADDDLANDGAGMDTKDTVFVVGSRVKF